MAWDSLRSTSCKFGLISLKPGIFVNFKTEANFLDLFSPLNKSTCLNSYYPTFSISISQSIATALEGWDIKSPKTYIILDLLDILK